jgi:hypothetical protein
MTHATPMTTYRCNFVAGGSYFFTVNLSERRLRLLTDHIELLRRAFRSRPGSASGDGFRSRGWAGMPCGG